MAQHFRDRKSSLLHRTLLIRQSTFLVRADVHDLPVFQGCLNAATAGAHVTKGKEFLLCLASWGIETHAHRTFADQCVAERMIFRVLGQAFGGYDRFSVGIDCQHKARVHSLLIHDDRAAGAFPHAATFFRLHELQVVPERFHERVPRLHLEGVVFAVYLELDLTFHDLASSTACKIANFVISVTVFFR